MRVWTTAAAIVACFVVSPMLSAQWPPHPSTNVPRTPDGKAGFERSCAQDRRWQARLRRCVARVSGRGRGAAPEDPPPGTPVVATFRNVGAGFKDGLPLRPWAAELLKKRMDDNSKDNPEAVCLPMGIVQLHTRGFPRKVHSDADAARHPLRGQLRTSADLHRRAFPAERRSAIVVVPDTRSASGRATRWW